LQNYTFSILLTHYGDPYWVKKAISSAKLLDLELINDVFIIDNNHGDIELIGWASQQPKVRMLEYPSLGSGNAHHANALNSFLGEGLVNASHLIIMDSDLLVQSNDWLEMVLEILESSESCLALDPISDYLTHPCFMVIPMKALSSLDFMEGMKSLKIDTGRTVGLQLSNLGISTHLLKPKPGYGGKLGFTYLNGKLFHVTSISIRQQPTRRVGKSTFRISLAESWRRWIVDSTICKKDSKICGIQYSVLQLFFVARYFLLNFNTFVLSIRSPKKLVANSNKK
jgi:hypothetical protein